METIPFPTDPALYFLIRKQVVFQFRVTRLQHVAALNEPRRETAVIAQNPTRFRHDYFDLFRLLVGEVCKRRIVLFFLFRRRFDSSFFGLFRFGSRIDDRHRLNGRNRDCDRFRRGNLGNDFVLFRRRRDDIPKIGNRLFFRSGVLFGILYGVNDALDVVLIDARTDVHVSELLHQNFAFLLQQLVVQFPFAALIEEIGDDDVRHDQRRDDDRRDDTDDRLRRGKYGSKDTVHYSTPPDFFALFFRAVFFGCSEAGSASL